jgi:catechol 2,3-dioxygenase-like lactoylglutathione lyase family enzyme
MAIQRMDHVGVVVEDLAAARDFFVVLGFTVQGEWTGAGEVVDRIIGLSGVETKAAMIETAEGAGRLELIQFVTPPAEDGAASAPANARGIRHLAFVVDDIDATLAAARSHGAELVGEVEQAGGFRLCYIRGPEGIIVELAEKLVSSR